MEIKYVKELPKPATKNKSVSAPSSEVTPQRLVRNKKVFAEDIIAAYKETGSGWAAAKRLGITGQTVYSKLKSLGYSISHPEWSDEEIVELTSLVNAGCTMSDIASRLGRSFSGVAGQASKLGLFTRKGRSKRHEAIPRGAGYDKVSTRKNLDLFYNYDGTITKFSKAHGLAVEHLSRAFQRHFPDEWQDYIRSRSAGDVRNCEYCDSQFFVGSGRQRFCTRQCSADSRADSSYFGGNRRQAIGWDKQQCQVCGRSNIKGLTPHHALGKENDPDDTYLVAVCRGCHQAITVLAAKSRDFVDSEAAWETLIALVWLRRHGDDEDYCSNNDISVCVEIEQITLEDEDSREYSIG